MQGCQPSRWQSARHRDDGREEEEANLFVSTDGKLPLMRDIAANPFWKARQNHWSQ